MSSCGKDQEQTMTSTEAFTAAAQTTHAESEKETQNYAAANESTISETENNQAIPQSSVQTEGTTAEPTLPPSNGTMYFTDSPDSKFIKAVSAQYDVDPKLLAAIYKIPEDDSNCVWQFSGEKDAAGKIIRSAETLKYVYVVSSDTNTICRTGGKDGNIGMTTAEGYFTFKTTKNIILPRFANELSG